MSSKTPKLKVLLVDEDPDRALRMREALAGARCSVVGALCTAREIPEAAARTNPDVVIIETDSPLRDAVESLAFTKSTGARPVVMFTGDPDDAGIRAAIDAGVAAYVVDGLTPRRLRPILLVARERFVAEQALRQELADTRQALKDRKLIERAKGVLMRARGLDEENAFGMLRKFAMDRGLSLAQASSRVLDLDSLI
ncbi:MAG: ANTAR domain-containing protein [Betaproteobacteria bacterium]|nr:ANTAR domain-containing protein [Betaproteobacteria bacterium]